MWVVILAIVSAAATVPYTVATMTIDTDTLDLISDETPFLRTYKAYKAQFPRLNDTVTVLLEADTPDRVRAARDTLTTALNAQPEHFPYVYAPGAGAFFANNGLFYLSEAELLDLLDDLGEAQPLLQRLRQDMSLRGLSAVLRLGIDDALTKAAPLEDLALLFTRMGRVIENLLDGVPAQLSWVEIMHGTAPTAADLRAVIVVQPAALDYAQLMPGAAVLQSIRDIAAAAALTPTNGVTVSLTGTVALGHDELESAQLGAQHAGLVALFLVAVILLVGLRSIRLVIAALVTLAIGLVWTAWFAAVLVGHLNLISIAFAVLFVSLGIDASIHYGLRFREMVAAGFDPTAAVAKAGRAVGGALTLCAVSTAVGFYAFLLTDYDGVSELGVIAGTGMFVSLFANLTVLPALLTLVLPPGSVRPRSQRANRFAHWPHRNARPIAIGAAVLALVGLAVAPQVGFDPNPLNLQNPARESVTALRTLLDDTQTKPWTASVVAADRAEAASLKTAFEQLPEVDEAITLDDFVPADQDTKYEIIQDIAFVSEPDPFALAPGTASTPDEEQLALKALLRALDQVATARPDAPAGVSDLRTALDRALRAGDDRSISLAAIRDAWLGALPYQIALLDASLTAAPFTESALPEDLRAQFQARDGGQRVQVFPAEDIVANNDALVRFVDAVRTVAEDITDQPVLVLEAGDTVITAFIQALLAALVSIAALLLIVTRRPIDVALVMAPLLLGALLTAAIMTLAGMTFNFANVIVLPLLLGIGVDSAIHLMRRQRAAPAQPVLATSTARAALLSAATTMAGFGALAVSEHVGTASMGMLLIIGVGVTFAATILLLPALMTIATARTQEP